MTGLKVSLSDSFDQASLWANGVRTQVQQGAVDKYNSVQAYANSSFQAIRQECHESAAKTKSYILDHKKELFFAGCALITAYSSPLLFFTAAIVTVFIRVEGMKDLEELADTYLGKGHHPFINSPQNGPHYISKIDMILGTIAAVDAVVLATFFLARFFSLGIMPILGGIAAGNVAAKIGMDLADSYFA